MQQEHVKTQVDQIVRALVSFFSLREGKNIFPSVIQIFKAKIIPQIPLGVPIWFLQCKKLLKGTKAFKKKINIAVLKCVSRTADNLEAGSGLKNIWHGFVLFTIAAL